MIVKVTVCREAEGEEALQERLFSKKKITIGRGEANHLTLPGSSDLVEDKHIFVRQSDESCEVMSWGEETALNGDGIPALRPQEIQDGDMLEVGPFQIEFQFLDKSDVNGTIDQEAGQDNPFDDPVGRLVSAFELLAAVYEDTAPQQREEALAEALTTTRDPVCTHKAVRAAVAQLLEEAAGDGAAGDKEGAGNDSAVAGPFVASGEEWPVLRSVTDALATVLEVPGQFRREFIGHALSHPPEARFLYEGEGATIRATLLDPSLSTAERTKRFEYLEEAAESVVRHQIAVVDGYKASVSEGMKEVLTRVDPETHRDEVVDENEIFGYVPALAQRTILERVREACRDLLDEDWSVAEQRIFRPAFRKAYLAHMTSPHEPRAADEPQM